MKVLIVEDDLSIQSDLQKMLQKIEHEIEVIGCLDSVSESVSWLQKNRHPEIIFLDINLSDGNSFEIFKQVTVKSFVIFITAYAEYAVQAFKTNSIDYLIKPIDKEQLSDALTKYDELTDCFQRNHCFQFDFDELYGTVKHSQPNYRKRFLIKHRESYTKLSVANIAFFLAQIRLPLRILIKEKKSLLTIRSKTFANN